MPNRDYGFKPPVFKEGDYTFGDANIPDEILCPDGDWRPYLPDLEVQNVNQVETFNCVAFGTTNACEALLFKKYGIKFDFSDRALGIMAGTGTGGNDPQTVAETFRHQGDFDETLLPFSSDIKTIDDYYKPKPLPIELILEAMKFIGQYDFKHDYVGVPGSSIPHNMLKIALQRSPIAIAVNAWTESTDGYQRIGPDNHWTLLVAFEGANPIIFDSYEKKGSELKKLRSDYEFYYAKRYWLKKKSDISMLDNTKSSTICNLLRSWWEEIIK